MGEAWLVYFFLVGFLVAFFFIALFSLGLDLTFAIPGFFFAAAIRLSSSWVAAAERASSRLRPLARILPIIEIRYVRIKRSRSNLERNFKYGDYQINAHNFGF